VLYVNSSRPNKFDLDDVQVVAALANQAAIAIENARLFASVAEGRDQLQAILNSSHDGILMFDASSRIITVNPRLEEMWDLSRVGLENQKLFDLLDQSDFQIAAKLGYRPEILRAQLNQVRVGQPLEWPTEVFAMPSGSRQRFIQRSGMPVLDVSKRLIGWMVVLRDVTEEREIQQMREDLTNMIVHDLRTPLSSILGSLQLLEDSFQKVSPTSIEGQALAISLRSTRKMLDLVNSLLDISKLTSGQAMIDSAPTPLAAVIDVAIERLSPLALEAGVIIRKHLQPDLPLVLIDEDKISRVLMNLLDNALKFTPLGGQVTILAEHTRNGDPAESNFVRCTVRDTGPGIPADFRQRIFDRFVQIGDRTTRRRGTGLGLSFCQLAVEAHGGKIWVNDAPNGGSEFCFTLPIVRPAR
jgi:NtrC-family two-component system sensor histidine kinase KinB